MIELRVLEILTERQLTKYWLQNIRESAIKISAKW